MHALSLLESWYSAQCNGDWEHQCGVKIDTLDNPGWSLEIDLRGTSAEARSIERLLIERTEHDWLEYWIENGKFKAYTGPKNLSEAIGIFCRWFENPN